MMLIHMPYIHMLFYTHENLTNLYIKRKKIIYICMYVYIYIYMYVYIYIYIGQFFEK